MRHTCGNKHAICVAHQFAQWNGHAENRGSFCFLSPLAPRASATHPCTYVSLVFPRRVYSSRCVLLCFGHTPHTPFVGGRVGEKAIQKIGLAAPSNDANTGDIEQPLHSFVQMRDGLKDIQAQVTTCSSHRRHVGTCQHRKRQRPLFLVGCATAWGQLCASASILTSYLCLRSLYIPLSSAFLHICTWEQPAIIATLPAITECVPRLSCGWPGRSATTCWQWRASSELRTT